MKTDEDFYLTEKVQNENCETSLKRLIEKHSALCYKICSKYNSALSTKGVSVRDVLDEKSFIIFKAAQTFKTNKNTKFSTWLGNYTRYHCLNIINSNKRYVCVEEKELVYHIDKKTCDEQPTENFNDLREFTANILSQLRDKRIKKVFQLRYFSDSKKTTWNNIAKNLNISIQTAINLHDKGVAVLNKKISSKEFRDFV